MDYSFYFAAPLDRVTLDRKIITILAFSVFFCACKKEHLETAEDCLVQTDNPDQRSYSANDVSYYSYIKKHCGLIPFSSKHYWIYLDSTFNDGVFVTATFDTLQFEKS